MNEACCSTRSHVAYVKILYREGWDTKLGWSSYLQSSRILHPLDTEPLCIILIADNALLQESAHVESRSVDL